MDDLPANYRNLQAALQPPAVYRDKAHMHYHDAQASRRDTAAKRLARVAGLNFVVCGCGEEFNADNN